jgi:hypothetical protein
LQVRKCKWEEYKGTRYSDGDSALVPSAGSDDTSDPVVMLVNSSELCVADFPLAEVRSLQFDEVARGDRRTRGEGVRKL